MDKILSLRVRGGGGVYGTIQYRHGDDAFAIATRFGREHDLQPAAVLRLTNRIRSQAEQVFKIRGVTVAGDHGDADGAAVIGATGTGTEWEDSEFDNTGQSAAPPTFLNMRIKGRDGVFGTIQFHVGDNPLEVAARFGREHYLPPDAVARLAVKIQSQLDALAVLNGPPLQSDDPFTALCTETKRGELGSPPRLIGSNNDDDGDGERAAEEAYQAARRRLASPEAAPLGPTASEQGSEVGEQAWADAQRTQRARALSPASSALIPGLEGAAGSTNEQQQQQQQRSRSRSPLAASAARTRKQQQLVCERLHAQARRMQDRKASLKQRVETDKANEIFKTSFRAQSRSPSPRRAGSRGRTRGQPRAG